MSVKYMHVSFSYQTFLSDFPYFPLLLACPNADQMDQEIRTLSGSNDMVWVKNVLSESAIDTKVQLEVENSQNPQF